MFKGSEIWEMEYDNPICLTIRFFKSSIYPRQGTKSDGNLKLFFYSFFFKFTTILIKLALVLRLCLRFNELSQCDIDYRYV